MTNKSIRGRRARWYRCREQRFQVDPHLGSHWASSCHSRQTLNSIGCNDLGVKLPLVYSFQVWQASVSRACILKRRLSRQRALISAKSCRWLQDITFYRSEQKKCFKNEKSLKHIDIFLGRFVNN